MIKRQTCYPVLSYLNESGKETQADVILMDLQYAPAVLTPAKKEKATAMVKAIGELARDGVNVFRRFAFMKGLYEVEQVSFDRMVDPADEHRLHDSDWATHRVAWAMKARDRRRRRQGGQGAIIGSRAFATIACKLSALSP